MPTPQHFEPPSLRAILAAVEAELIAKLHVDNFGPLRDIRIVERNVVNIIDGFEGVVEYPAAFIEYGGGAYHGGRGFAQRQHRPEIIIYVCAHRLNASKDAILGYGEADGGSVPDDWGVTELLEVIRRTLAFKDMGLELEGPLLPTEEEPAAFKANEDSGAIEVNIYQITFECRRDVDDIPDPQKGEGINTEWLNPQGATIAIDKHDYPTED